MFRVVEVPLAFAQAAPACHGELLLEVSGDTMVPANNGVFRIFSLGGAAQAIRTRIYMGFPVICYLSERHFMI
jgi:ABC-type arginine/histidine transport system permease subunit